MVAGLCIAGLQEMATEFPHVKFRSLDVVPITAHIPRPNIVFEVYDITEGLLLGDNSQDIVFVNVAIEMVCFINAVAEGIFTNIN